MNDTHARSEGVTNAMDMASAAGASLPVDTIADMLRANDAGAANVGIFIERCISRATADHAGPAFRVVHCTRARAEAARFAARPSAGAPLRGAAISIKDNVDEAGELTLAGSPTRRSHPPADTDAAVVSRLREAGAIMLGRTTMSEFAYSGVGTNPHFGTPLNPFDRATRRIPGGSSSGAVVSVTDGMCHAAIGTDTGGSIRIPAALCGMVGFKATAASISMHGVLPLSQSLDSLGIIARTVDCVRRVYRALAKQGSCNRANPVRLLVPTNYILDGVDRHVGEIFDRILRQLAGAGVKIIERRVPAFDIHRAILACGGIIAAEAYRNLRSPLSYDRDAMDPRVVRRAMAGATIPYHSYLQLLRMRGEFQRSLLQVLGETDALAMPTVPIIAPTIDAVADDIAHEKTNRLLLRNPSTINMLDGCAITLPSARSDEPPVGLMLAMPGGYDETLLAIAEAIQPLLWFDRQEAAAQLGPPKRRKPATPIDQNPRGDP